MPGENTGVENAQSPSAASGEGGESSPGNNENNNMIPKERLDEVLTQNKSLVAKVEKLTVLQQRLSQVAQQNPNTVRDLLDGKQLDSKDPVPSPPVVPGDINFDEDLDAPKRAFTKLSQEIEVLKAEISRNNKATEQLGRAALSQQGVNLMDDFDTEFAKLGYDEKEMGLAFYNKTKEDYRKDTQFILGTKVHSNQTPTRKDVISAVKEHHANIGKLGELNEKRRLNKLKIDSEKRGGKTFIDMPPGESVLQSEKEKRPETDGQARDKLRRNLVALGNSLQNK